MNARQSRLFSARLRACSAATTLRARRGALLTVAVLLATLAACSSDPRDSERVGDAELAAGSGDTACVTLQRGVLGAKPTK